jgi:hypothetical protein
VRVAIVLLATPTLQHSREHQLLVVLTFFLASLVVFAAFGSAFFFAALTFSGSLFLAALAFTLAFGFLVARAVFGTNAVFAVGSQTYAVGAGHLAMLHTSVSLLHRCTSGVGDGVFSGGVAVAGNHCESKCDSEESGHKSFFHCFDKYLRFKKSFVDILFT